MSIFWIAKFFDIFKKIERTERDLIFIKMYGSRGLVGTLKEKQ
jgi:hypothetical protein